MGVENVLVEMLGVLKSSGGQVDSEGAAIAPDNHPQALTYNGDGTLATVSFTDGDATWTKTFNYTAGNVTGVSAWVKS